MKKVLTVLALIALILCLATVAWATDTTADTSQNGLIVLSGLGTNWTWTGGSIELLGYAAEFAKTAGKSAQIRIGSTSGPTLPMLYSVDGGSQAFYLPGAVRWIPVYNASDNDLAPGSKIYIFYQPK